MDIFHYSPIFWIRMPNPIYRLHTLYQDRISASLYAQV